MRFLDCGVFKAFLASGTGRKAMNGESVMQLFTNLTRLIPVTALVLALAACAAPSARIPAATDDKSADTSLRQACLDAQARGSPPPAGCEAYTTQRSRNLPDWQQDPLLSAPTLPSLGDGPLIRR